MSEFSIVPMLTDEDKKGKGYVHWKSWHETYKGLIPEKYLENITLENCIEMAYRWPQNTLILKKDNEVIGFSCYGDNKEGEGELIAIYLLAEYQGKKLGYALINEALKKLSSKNTVTLWVLKGNEKAINFYERYGFQFDGTEKVNALGTELRMICQQLN